MKNNRKITVHKGYVKFLRLGPIKHAEQSRWSVRAPTMKGIWAFPDPYFDMFFAYHKYTDLMPKKFRRNENWYPTDPRWYHDKGKPVNKVDFDDEGEPLQDYDSEAFHEQRENWLNNTAKKVLPIREFWYKGDVFTHFLPNGEIGCAPSSSKDDSVEWSRMSTQEYVNNVRKNGGNKTFYRYKGQVEQVRSSVDHLEVFIAPNMGKLLESDPNKNLHYDKPKFRKHY